MKEEHLPFLDRHRVYLVKYRYHNVCKSRKSSTSTSFTVKDLQVSKSKKRNEVKNTLKNTLIFAAVGI